MGIQLSQGLSFPLTAVKYIEKLQDFSKSKVDEDDQDRRWLSLDGFVLATCACFMIFVDDVGHDC